MIGCLQPRFVTPHAAGHSFSRHPVYDTSLMTQDEFREIEAVLAHSHADMALQLGISEVSVKRYATSAQPIPEHIARLMVALLVLSDGRGSKRYREVLAQYHVDT